LRMALSPDRCRTGRYRACKCCRQPPTVPLCRFATNRIVRVSSRSVSRYMGRARQSGKQWIVRVFVHCEVRGDAAVATAIRNGPENASLRSQRQNRVSDKTMMLAAATALRACPCRQVL
jgi:hypothetical protein